MEKCDIVEELGRTCRLGSDEIRGSASCLPKYLYDQESQVPYASWSILWQGGLASWAEGSQQTHTSACRIGTGRKKGGRLGSVWVAQRVSHFKSTTRLVEHKEIKTYPLFFGFFFSSLLLSLTGCQGSHAAIDAFLPFTQFLRLGAAGVSHHQHTHSCFSF